MEEVKAFLAKHKYLVGGGLIIVVVGWFILTRSGGGSTAVQSGIDPTEASLYAQESQQNAQLQANQDQITGQIDLAQIQAGTAQQANTLGAQVDLAQVGAQLTASQDQIAAQIQESNNNLTGQQTAIWGQLQGLLSNNATTEHIAAINADENTQIAGLTAATQLGIANLTSQTQVAISNNQAQVGIAQANDQLQATKAITSASTTNQAISTGGGIFGKIIGAIL